MSVIRAGDELCSRLALRGKIWGTLYGRGHQVRSWRAGVPAEFSSNTPEAANQGRMYTWNFQAGVLRQVEAKLCRTPALQEQV